jgi:hypothetical protein
MSELVDNWPAAVGATIARNAWPARIARDGTLHVNTVDSVWAFELTSRAAEIARRVGVAQVRFAAGPLPEPETQPAEAAPRTFLGPSDDARAEADRLTRGIEDEDLREVVAKAAAMSLDRAAVDRSVW